MRTLSFLITCVPFIGVQAVIPERASEQMIQSALEQGSALKKNGRWEEHVRLAEEAIQSARRLGALSEEAALSTQLASTAFYQGDYRRTAELAERAREIYRGIGNRPGLCASLYLLSAALRGQKNYPEAERLAREALDYVDGDSLLEGKARFNLAAALMDREAPLPSLARKELETAYACFQAAGDEDYRGRTSLRLAKTYLLENDGEKALELLEKTKPFTWQERANMHYSFVRAQALAHLNRREEALAEAITALAIAEKLGAAEDLNRIKKWINTPKDIQ